jgi:hypothetical protein
MTDAHLTDQLVLWALGWRLGSDRYIKSDRGWIPRSKFQPLTDIRDAFRILDALTHDYSLRAVPNQGFTVEVRHGKWVGRAKAEHKARAISLAVAAVMRIEIEATR